MARSQSRKTHEVAGTTVSGTIAQTRKHSQKNNKTGEIIMANKNQK